jgi:hypothetical protein
MFNGIKHSNLFNMSLEIKQCTSNYNKKFYYNSQQLTIITTTVHTIILNLIVTFNDSNYVFK